MCFSLTLGFVSPRLCSSRLFVFYCTFAFLKSNCTDLLFIRPTTSGDASLATREPPVYKEQQSVSLMEVCIL